MCRLRSFWRMALLPIDKIGASAAVFWRDTSGIILPYVTLMLVVIIGLAVLALDGARYMSLQTQLQNAADALALAAAAELDRLPDAQARASAALRNPLSNSPLVVSSHIRHARHASV